LIISHKYKYLFIEIPLTASWAIHHELCHHYDGQPILHKHATYSEFRHHATFEELSYFVFATVRNPLDKIVSIYFKLKNDQKGIFSDSKSLSQGIIDYSDQKKYQYINNHGADFESFFRKYYKLPYSDMINLSGKYLDYVVRFENIQEDLAVLLMKLSVEQIQPLPLTNETPGKSKDFLTFYTPVIIPQAKRVCGPYMKNWSYQIPESWGNSTISSVYDFVYRGLNQLRFFYTIYLRYNNAGYAKLLRKLRAKL
jgi:hypothetical protein